MSEQPLIPGWEVVIGLEVHAELATVTKMFSSAPNQFGGEPNTNVDPVSLGLPGSLPVLNEKAVELAIRVGLALDCRIQRSVFARKNYFYPDMPKDFQISQYDLPINGVGSLELPDGRRIGIERAHLEEDTGKSTHVGGGGRIHEAGHSLIDYNRSGVPLIEIVSAPDMRGAEDARAYVSELRAILVAIGASDGKMEEGSMRVDCNVSVRREGTTELGTRCEVKNINSLRSMGRAIEYEARRQVDLIESGETVEQQTRHWNEDDGCTHKLRSKEEAYDYRYFPEPDLVPVEPSDEWIAEIRATLPMLPRDRRRRLADVAAVEPSDTALTVERGMDDLAVDTIAACAGAGPRREQPRRRCGRTDRRLVRCARGDGDRRRSHRHPGQDRARRPRRLRGRPHRARRHARLRGHGHLRPRGPGRPPHRRTPRRLGRVRRRR